MKLELGVQDVAYSEQSPDGGKARRTTTGAVAEILEERYHVMGTFFELKKEQIAQYLADGMAGAIEDRIAGRKSSDIFARAETQIDTAFRTFLDANEMQKLSIMSTGFALSAAAIRGVSRRKKHPFSQKNKQRPAFIDTGLYRRSFRAKVKT